jgi:hypothetical protein
MKKTGLPLCIVSFMHEFNVSSGGRLGYLFRIGATGSRDVLLRMVTLLMLPGNVNNHSMRIGRATSLAVAAVPRDGIQIW